MNGAGVDSRCWGPVRGTVGLPRHVLGFAGAGHGGSTETEKSLPENNQKQQDDIRGSKHPYVSVSNCREEFDTSDKQETDMTAVWAELTMGIERRRVAL